MKKIIDFLVIFLLAFLIINLFQDKEPKKDDLAWVTIQALSANYTVPASVKVQVKNATKKEIVFTPCKDVHIKTNAGTVQINAAELCKKITVPAQMTYTIDYAKSFKKFETPWEYFVEATIGNKDVMSRFEIETRGTISKIFIAFVYQPILNLMDWLIQITWYSLWWAIIIITIIVRLVLLLPQHKMMVSQKKLQAVQPKIKAIQEKYKGQQAKLGQELMALYKKEKVNPMGSCGFMMIQMPILFVLYRVIMEVRDPSNVYYLYDFLDSFQISNINHNFYSMDLFSTGMETPVQSLLLALFVWWVQFLQMKLSLAKNKTKTEKWAVLEKKKWDTWYASMMPDPELMNKFMLYGMPLMVGVFTFTFFAWLGLYWGVSTTFMIFQQAFVNKILKKNKA